MSPETREKVEESLSLALALCSIEGQHPQDYLENCKDVIEAALALLREDDGWCYDMEKAPRGNGDVVDNVLLPQYVEPPKILMLFEEGEQSVVYWDWYYAEG